VATIPYDEFGLFHENAEEAGLPFDGPPQVVRREVATDDGRLISSLRWGADDPGLVLLHGGAQNAHTYDTVALALDTDLLAIDLPGHGHSDGGREGALDAGGMAADVAIAMEALAAPPVTLVGMSLGGMVAINVAASRPDLVSRLMLVDVTPGVDGSKAAHITAFIDGPPGFTSFDELLARTIEFNPTRSEASLRRGILHNAVQLDDGSWVWRWARHRVAPGAVRQDHAQMWDVLGSLEMPVMLVRGMSLGSVVDDEDEAMLLSRLPGARIERVEGAGHSVQGDQPLVLAGLIAGFSAPST